MLVIFQSLIALKTITVNNQRKIIFFTLQKGYAVALINTQKAILLSSLKVNDKNFQFYIQPVFNQLRIKHIHFIEWEIDTNLIFFTKKNHQINFAGYRILLLDRFFDRKIISKSLIFNTVWLHQNPNLRITDLRKSVTFESIVIDATNSNYNLKAYVDEANKFQIQSHVLKKNKAYLVDLNNQP
ncbi:MAG: hypothetical protein H7202_00085 [Pedobacter sp.]|nr:hypothetical protein [Pedobacter sp.]